MRATALTTRPGRLRARLVDDLNDIRGAELVLAMVLVLDEARLPGLNVSVSLVALAALAIFGLTRPARFSTARVSWVFVALAAALFYVSMVSVTAPPNGYASDWVRRIIRISAVAVVALHMASGRLHVTSLIRGMAIGLVANLIAFQAHLAPNYYSGALTGWLGDKNKAALYYTVVALLLLPQLKSRAETWFFAALAFVPIWLTASRTSLSAYVMGLIWWGLFARRPLPVRLMGACAVVWLIKLLETQYARVGVFASRVGSDALRARIDAATEVKLSKIPVQGRGLGEAYVVIGNDKWFFHDSFATLRVEGGWPYLVVVVGVTLVTALLLLLHGARTAEEAAIQGAGIALLICAWKLGEVFLTTPWGLLVGAGLSVLTRADPRPAPSRPAPEPGGATRLQRRPRKRA